MNIEIREKDDERAVFVVEGVDDTFINTIRRICLVEIPTLAIEDVNIYKNDAKMFDEVLAHRLGLIPIVTDLDSYVMPSECDCESGCQHCRVSFLLKEKCEEGNDSKIVYSKDLKSDDPAVKPVYDTIPIVRLREGEEVELEAIAELGLGSEHAKWQATTTCGYKYYPIVVDFEESKYIFKIETDGSLKPFDVLTIACDILSEKADNIINFVNEEE